MKKIIYVTLMSCLIGYVARAQKISANKVPAAVSTAFKTKFASATKVNWEIENKTEFEADFYLNGKEMSANFDKAGNWLETEIEIKVSELPVSIQSALKKDFVGYKVEEASKIENVKDGNCFEAEVEKAKETFEILFSPEGKFLRKTKVEEKEKKD